MKKENRTFKNLRGKNNFQVQVAKHSVRNLLDDETKIVK